jgi:hypothetical protein
MVWELRYRARMVDNVWIETEGETETEAREVADYYLSTLNSPAVVFVRLRPMVAMSTTRMRAAKSGRAVPEPEPLGNPVQAASRGGLQLPTEPSDSMSAGANRSRSSNKASAPPA